MSKPSSIVAAVVYSLAITFIAPAIPVACPSIGVKRRASLGRGNSRTCPWNGRQS